MGVIDNMKDIADLIKKAGDVDLYRKIVESEGEVIELTREKRQLEEKVEELERILALQKQMSFKAPFYFQDGDNTPYCPACWENQKRAIHVEFVFDNSERTRWDCPVCNHSYAIRKREVSTILGNPGPGTGGGWMGR